ncbi:MAG: 3-dehydroquinate synthase [Phycisphaerales bacterium]|nr:3-dehydroquinate synthase [Planctomycetota bacterium]MBL6996836.1 3-dehydroquinate synthase [Phycisphaerales bacterium]
MTCSNNSIDAPFTIKWTHKLRLTNSSFTEGGVLDSLLATLQPLKILVVVDDGVTSNQPFLNSLHKWCERTGAICDEPLIVIGGEAAKNDFNVVNSVLEAINHNNLCRKSCIIVIGGGAVLDAVGFAASTAHRGLPIIRMPSTSLSQGDSGVGVKNGVNYFGKKNFVGVFDPPYAVINDSSLLQSLDKTQWRSGLSEAIKVALIKDESLFEQIEANSKLLLGRDINAMVSVLQQSAKLHLRHITDGGDPFERLDARPLDFGHWAAHKLEQLTNYTISHGDAVAIGLSIDVACSVRLGFLDNSVAMRIVSLLDSLGFPTNHSELTNTEFLTGIEEFRQHLGGQLTLLMLKGIEEPTEIHRLDHEVVRQVINELR